jgi:hypothetical protein
MENFVTFEHIPHCLLGDLRDAIPLDMTVALTELDEYEYRHAFSYMIFDRTMDRSGAPSAACSS